ncbi:hypothetical protein [Lysinibacillus odysseyi]|uniref:Uncharacterized protein n=1 Tax=Lysinibacillus odysseyi 34hs-1 = NBRC 100172 TaxID=1220589 RepID=A0A0A3J283_9BACI|nr:hypothetical protein [Lysinibacillus odysseyi]KGR89268.1 hypothetical protein CD32_00510 [Lysinibacillus odysseyi 34hs-1 = NBRC 100172]
MQVLMVLSQIWKSGAEIYRDESDNRLALKNAKKIPEEVLKAAEPIFPDIEKWFASWEQAEAVDITIMKMLHLFCGWQSNQKINEWLSNDLESLDMLDRWCKALDRNGWKNIYDDFRQYENEESNKLKQALYDRAKVYFKKGA